MKTFFSNTNPKSKINVENFPLTRKWYCWILWDVLQNLIYSRILTLQIISKLPYTSNHLVFLLSSTLCEVVMDLFLIILYLLVWTYLQIFHCHFEICHSFENWEQLEFLSFRIFYISVQPLLILSDISQETL